ncbi:MAG TPA: histidinol-phosphate transaminase [Acidimicrobiia bacterium]|nr:histidinol-phosphate transaminase [Acidimicrobiia bacterium]
MPRFRSDITSLKPYKVGRQLADVARAHGLDPSEIVKLTANEGPEGPFPGVVEAVTREMAQSNRYPDNDCWDLGHVLAEELGIGFENLLFGAGSVALISEVAMAAGGAGTNLVYGWPSFIMYRFAAIWAGSDYREVPLSSDHGLDLDAMAAALDANTRVVIVCNPNNPTGTIRPTPEIEEFIDSVPSDVLVIVDEAYHEFVTDPSYRTEIPLAVERDNVLVLRTFSKIYALAAHRIGYAVGKPKTLAEIRKAQAPLTVSRTAQAAALASLGQPEELERRRADNSARLHHLSGALAERSIEYVPSHTNFIYFHLGERADEVVEEMTTRGVLIRGMSPGWVRVTVGNDEENRRFLQALDSALESGDFE